MDKQKLSYYKKVLMTEKERLEKELNSLTNDERKSLKESTGELSSYDNHPGDEGSNTFDREVDLGLEDNTRLLLKQVNDALEKIESGEYGVCQRCGKEIKESRLEAVPETSFCENCQEVEENLEGERERPLEESSYYPPLRSFNDKTGYNAYDGEDAWQDVAKYGTSETQQDVPETINGEEPEKEAFVDSQENTGVVGIEDNIYNDNGEEDESRLTGRKGKS